MLEHDAALVAGTNKTSAPGPGDERFANLARLVRYARDPVDEEAIEEFHGRYPKVDFSGICLVIPAYEEERSIGKVLSSVPETALGLRVSTLVVVDGGHDQTAAIARNPEFGAYACICSTNRGQGAALRLGYRLAIEHGADYIVTVDADGQWDASQIERLLQPLVSGEADFVQGSRRLGETKNPDPMRNAGVVFFAGLINFLTGSRITDSSSGIRAFRPEVVADLTLDQDQYQSSELLIGVLARRWRVAEVPVVMHRRAAGRSKKGRNLVYGYRYGRVVLGTWWRYWKQGAFRGFIRAERRTR